MPTGQQLRPVMTASCVMRRPEQSPSIVPPSRIRIILSSKTSAIGSARHGARLTSLFQCLCSPRYRLGRTPFENERAEEEPAFTKLVYLQGGL